MRVEDISGYLSLPLLLSPFSNDAHVRRVYPDSELTTYIAL
jgi:hypothetical protein